jgi:hypothetical protein
MTSTFAELLLETSPCVLLLNWCVLPFATAARRAATLGSAELCANALLNARARLFDPLFLSSPSSSFSSTSSIASTSSTGTTAFVFSLFLRAPAGFVLPAPIELFSNAPWSATTRAEELALSPMAAFFLAATRCSRMRSDFLRGT